MQKLKDLEDALLKEVGKISSRGEILPNEIHPMYEVVDMIKDIETIFAMKGYSGYSGSYPYMHEDGYSGRRMGRYSYGEDPAMHIRQMMNETNDPVRRDVLQQCLNRMER